MIKNSMLSYGIVARFLHWTVATLFLSAYCAVYYRHWLTEAKTMENLTALHLHLSFGITISVFVLLRVIWTFYNIRPDPVPGTVWEIGGAKFMHGLLYCFMVIMPITGYMGTGVATDFFFLFDIPKFSDTDLYQWLVTDKLGISWKEFEEPVDALHKTSGKWLVWVLIGIHTTAALYHHFVRRDDTLIRMTTGKIR